jgi:hypothetical protein
MQAKDIGYIPLQTQNEIGTGPQDTSADFDFATFAAALSRPKSSKPVDTGEPSSAYDFIPTGLIATTTLTKARTSLQNQLYMYGNDVGDTITIPQISRSSGAMPMQTQRSRWPGGR